MFDYEPNCKICGNSCFDCVCPECVVCGEAGNPECIDKHMRSDSWRVNIKDYMHLLKLVDELEKQNEILSIELQIKQEKETEELLKQHPI